MRALFDFCGADFIALSARLRVQDLAYRLVYVIPVGSKRSGYSLCKRRR